MVGDWSGFVFKQGSLIKSWKKRFLVVQGRHVSYYDRSVHEPDPREKGSLVLGDVTQNFGMRHGLVLHDVKGRQMKMYTLSAVDFDACLAALQAACDLRGSMARPSLLDVRASIASSRASLADARGSLVLRSSLTETERRLSVADSAILTSERRSSVSSTTSVPNIQRGWLYKEGQRVRNWKRRYFVLTGDHIAYFAKQGENPKGEGRVVSVILDLHKPLGMLLQLDANDRVLRVAAETNDALARWHAAFTGCVRTLPKPRHCGILLKKGRTVKAWRKRYFSIDGVSNQLSYSDAETEPPKGYGKVVDVCVNTKRPFALYIHLASGRRLAVAGNTQNEADAWQAVLEDIAADVPMQYLDGSHHGWLQKEGSGVKSWKRRFFTLHGRTILYRKSLDAAPLGDGVVTSVAPGTARAFAIDIVLASGRVLVVAANSARDQELWLSALRDPLPPPTLATKGYVLLLDGVAWTRMFAVLEGHQLGVYSSDQLTGDVIQGDVVHVGDDASWSAEVTLSSGRQMVLAADGDATFDAWRNALRAAMTGADKAVSSASWSTLDADEDDASSSDGEDTPVLSLSDSTDIFNTNDLALLDTSTTDIHDLLDARSRSDDDDDDFVTPVDGSDDRRAVQRQGSVESTYSEFEDSD
ncbi:hypothetical protein SDRG_06288 [Saprolegnia diclina VS20]|uniref:PH domain-containing protein n=1 Tax=Saprolegnia diclina (strain VS20) TaxID=1156394 RepID=T0QQJ8_SAPDV|nr:hypothetical protein SDRG_06288 [Saprolegnia diclina VS20]EQC36175.1 hypothetical protein SDRG_06288 [Saprolegnia diclina VS20]|eukprot:XP_008610281.1 hypothetical protein SDRG_06288 [Saprolegnia diclina VS20]